MVQFCAAGTLRQISNSTVTRLFDSLPINPVMWQQGIIKVGTRCCSSYINTDGVVGIWYPEINIEDGNGFTINCIIIEN